MYSTVTFGKVVTAAGVDSHNAPTASIDTFPVSQKTIYVVAEAKDIDARTRLSAKWLRDGTQVMVSNEITTTEPYHNRYIEFHIDPGAEGWVLGNYTVQIIVNGEPGPQAKFTIKQY